MGTGHEHRVCTYDEAEASIRAAEKVWVNDCFCRGPAREGKTKYEWCGHDVDTCMGFTAPKGDEPFEVRVITQDDRLRPDGGG